MSLPQETKGALDVPTPKRLSWGLSALFEDPISYEVMSNPVMIPCGHSFDRESLSSWLNTRHACPVCQKPTQADQMASNYLLKEIIERYEKKKIELQTQPALPAAIDASSSSLFITSSAPAPSSSLSDLLYPFPHSSSSVDTTVHSAPSSSSSSVASFSPAAAASSSSSSSSSEPTVASSTTDHASTLRFRTNDSDIRVIELSAATASITYLGAVEKWSTISTSPGVSTGMHRWECNINRTERGVIMIGVMTPDCAVGKGHYLGDSSKSWGMLGVNGTLWNDSHKQRYASQGFRVNTIIGMILDCDRRTLSFDMNGQQLGLAAADLPLPLCFGLSFFNPDDRLEVNAFSSLKPEIGFCFSKLPKALNMVGLSELQHAGKEDQWHTAMSSVPIASGVHEWTVHIRVSKKGTLLIGLISSAAPNLPEGFYIGNNPSSWGLLGINGTTWHAAAKTKYSSGFRSGDSVTLRYDANSGVVEYFINQKGLGVAFTNVVPPVNFAISLFHCNDFVSIDSYTKFHTSSVTSPPVARIRSSSLLSSTAASSSSSLLAAPLSSAPVVSFAASSSALLEVNGGRVTHRTPEGWATIVVNGNEPTAGRIVQQSFFIEASFKGHILVGVCSVSEPLPDYLGSTPFSWGLLGINATFWRASTKDKTAVSRFGSGDLVTIVIDGIQRTLAFSVNGSPATTVDTFTCTNCRFAVSLFSANDSISLS